jgi:tryptophan synthase alpha chain
MARIASALERARQEGRLPVAPFLTVGDPDVSFTVAAVDRIARAGAALCELGVPYSDPIADGAVIQSSYTRALGRGTTVDAVFDVSRRVTASVAMPLVAMTSYSIIFRRGIADFVRSAADSGLSGLVVPDLPLEESGPLDRAARDAGISLTRLVTPTTPADRAERIARLSTGFLYCVSVAGVTGERSGLPEGLAERVAWLKRVASVPVLVGFGISSPEHVRAVAEVADGAIVGSAVVRHLERLADDSVGRDAAAKAAAAGTRELVLDNTRELVLDNTRELVLDGIESFVKALTAG